MSSLDVSRLSGPDAVVALRSFPRRIRSAVIPVADDPDAEERAERVGPTGHSAVEIVVHTTNTWVLLGQALHEALVADDAVVHPAVRDTTARAWDVPTGTTVHVALEQAADEATALAASVEHIHPPDWNRTAAVAGDGPITVLELVQEAVRAGAEGLRAVETTIAAVGP